MLYLILWSALGLVKTAHGNTSVVELIIATRDKMVHSEAVRTQLVTLAGLEDSSRVDITDISRKAPLVGGPESVLGLVRKRILANPTDESQIIELVIDAHGSTNAIHSDQTTPVSHRNFAREWRSLMSELVTKGYRPDKISFRLILHSCFSGKILSLLQDGLPFETILMVTSGPNHTALDNVLDVVLSRANALLWSAKQAGIDLCPSCRHQELVYLVLKYLSVFDLFTGMKEMPRPQLAWVSPNGDSPEDHLPELAHGLLSAYYRSLHPRSGLNKFRAHLEMAVGDAEQVTITAAMARIENRLSVQERAAYDALRLKFRYDELSTEDIELLFQRLGTSEDDAIREFTTDTLIVYHEIMEPEVGDRRLLKQIDYELAQPNPNLYALSRLQNRLAEVESPLHGDACAKLLAADKGVYSF